MRVANNWDKSPHLGRVNVCVMDRFRADGVCRGEVRCMNAAK